MKIEQWKDLLKDQSHERIQKRLTDTLDEIKLLESIYMTGGANSYCSQKFKDAAYAERQEKCQLSSACYSLLREMNVSI